MFYFNKKLIILTGILVGALFVFSLDTFCQNDSIRTAQGYNDTLRPVAGSQSIVIDTTQKNNRKHSPNIAILSSAVIPGLGQAYNKKYYKIPIIYGVGALIYYYFDYYNFQYQRVLEALEQISRNEPITDPTLATWNETSLIYKRNQIRRARDYQIVFLGALYLANIVDAMVDAYMYSYDVSDDLTMKIGPAFIPPDPQSYKATLGLKINFRF